MNRKNLEYAESSSRMAPNGSNRQHMRPQSYRAESIQRQSKADERENRRVGWPKAMNAIGYATAIFFLGYQRPECEDPKKREMDVCFEETLDRLKKGNGDFLFFFFSVWTGVIQRQKLMTDIYVFVPVCWACEIDPLGSAERDGGKKKTWTGRKQKTRRVRQSGTGFQKKETEERRKKNTDGLANERERSSLIQLAMTWNRPNSIAYRDTLWTFDGGIAQERSMYILHVHVEEGMRAGKMRTIDKLQIDLKNSGFHYSANRFFEKNRPCRRSSPHNLERLERFQSSRNEVKKKFSFKECCPFFSLFHVLFWFRFFTFVTTAFPTFKTFKCRLYYVLVEQ